MPISPVDTTWQDGGTQVRTQLPLRLCWAITMHKSQGQTLDKAVIDLGPKEACTGLSFVCLGRANRLVDLMAEPMSFDRIGNLGNCRKRLARSTSRSRASCCFPVRLGTSGDRRCGHQLGRRHSVLCFSPHDACTAVRAGT